MELLWYFMAGLFMFNSLPHLIKGITGQTHMTPFKRVSSPLLNIVWAFLNILVGLYLLGIVTKTGQLTLPWQASLIGIKLIAFILGGAFISLVDANLFSNPKARLPWHKD